jgi:nucleoside-diphosphate-sugar epimerase
LLEVVKNNKQVKGLVLASTNRAYPDGLTKNEFKQLLKSPYDLSKTVAQQVVQSYLSYFDLPIINACFGNVYEKKTRFFLSSGASWAREINYACVYD